MNRLLFLLLLLFSVHVAHSQMAYLFIKKGYKKKRTYTEGDRIYLQLKNDSVYTGLITQLKNDTIVLLGKPIPASQVKAVIVRQKQKKFHISGKDFLLITGGVVLTAVGLTLSDQAEANKAIGAGLTIGYGPLALAYLKSKISFNRKKFRIGRKFRLHILDFHMPRHRGF
jgi:hypothetical protein